MNINIIVIGSGSWGTSLAISTSYKFTTYLFVRDHKQAQIIIKDKENKKYLNNIRIPSSIHIITDLQKIIKLLINSKIIIILCIPISNLRKIVSELYNYIIKFQLFNISIIYTCKGLESNSCLLPHEVIDEVIPVDFIKYGVLSGPSFAQEVAIKLPTALTIASNHENLKNDIIKILHRDNIRIYTSSDIIGVEVGGALKNIIAIACGISDGLQLGFNARAAIITRGLKEIQNFGVKIGACPKTFFGLTGIGDLVLTATGNMSRNRNIGLEIGKGKCLKEISTYQLNAEGVKCAQAVLTRAKQLNIEVPIIEAVCDILFKGINPTFIVKKLLSKDSKTDS
ncbi:Glycerol-3-phosphate dehydrogenase [NAD(P)+] [Candidatus Kinetoplastibacterium sorsogonicusi]|uniref:Glycerol-3-phosphate dehydrogenase [NAD(P)+] n=1 Tax=Candidatus Kinetoplastidibacterium kentomonadis TaxID=1576550 RepID=A0A3Q8ERZ0_9PROT|nr:NAD(P)H-dependent glycerol-3-phosphate dehydrogenase [Candidatus Kinetoplastibacterium sorsogonicusi]AWD32711.1 Glycerol-3-phosphate dehydrogenase [NAD(P)+] [Candidatus Kinetoplastibacterium sorsogonicusi]